MPVALLIGTFFLLIAIGVPIAFALGGSSILYLLIYRPELTAMVPLRIWSGTNSFVMLALPLFILAGELMNRGGVTKRIVNFCNYVVRPIRGGLGEVNVIASMIFGGISGSSVADTSALGSVLIPQMIEKGYPKPVAVGITVASSTMGMIIPPSVPMLLYAMISGESVGALFLAGAIPGLLIGVTQVILVWIISKKRHYHPEHLKFDKRHFAHTMRDGSLAVLMPVLIVVSITFGVATPTEVAGIAVLYAILLGFLLYRELKGRDLLQVVKRAFLSSSSIMIIIGFSMIFSWILVIEKVPELIANFFLGLNIHRFWILLILDIIILIIGTFIDVTPALLLVVPMLMPVMEGIGISGLQFGAIMIVGVAIGLVTPPVGMCLNAAAKISKMEITDIFKGAVPYLVCNLIILLLVTFIPELSLWLPRVAGF
ncbi:MAG: TRAP transporter large permease [Candidatus Ratteibacteria bacterium]|nr:TRAP transporter large permease [Candidatus Ratteibacteria bacterium]